MSWDLVKYGLRNQSFLLFPFLARSEQIDWLREYTLLFSRNTLTVTATSLVEVDHQVFVHTVLTAHKEQSKYGDQRANYTAGFKVSSTALIILQFIKFKAQKNYLEI